MQAKHSDDDDDGEDDDDDGEDGDDEDENILFFEKIRPAIILYLLKVRLLSLSIVVWFPNPLAIGSGLGERRGQNALFFL